MAGTVHRDETTVHTHWFITPIFNTTSILRRTKEEKKNGTFRTITQPQLNATHWTGSPALMSQLQDRMWEGVFQHFGLERGEVELTPDRKKKKRNVRSDIHKRDVLLKEKEESLEIREKEQTKVAEKLVTIEMELEEKKTNLCKSESEFQREKIDFISEMATVGQNAVKEYNELKGSENFGNGDFPELPQPETKENIWHYHLKIKPIFDAVVFKAKYFFQQIKELRENHREEVKRLKESHDKDLESVKAKASVEKQNAVQKAIQKKSDEMQKTIDNLKKEIQGEKKEKEKWYNIIFNKFSMRIDGKNVEVNKGLKDAYIEKSLQLEEWENRNSDELLSLGIKYKKFKVRNWREYLVARSKPKTVDCDMVR